MPLHRAIPQDATGVAASYLATVISISVDTMLDYNKVCAGPGPGLSRRLGLQLGVC